MSNIKFNKFLATALSVVWFIGFYVSEEPESLIVANVFLAAVLIIEVIEEKKL